MRGIDFSRWKDYLLLLKLDSLWLFDRRESDEKLSFHGAFIPQVASQLIRRYTAQGDTVLDLFIGSGTTFKEAAWQKRKCIGVDLQPYTQPLPEGCTFIQGDSTSYIDIKEKIKAHTDSIQLIILHPPYHDIIKFSDDKRDLSNVSAEDFIQKIGLLALLCEELLDKKGIVAIVIGDKYEKGQVIPLSFYFYQQFSKWFDLKGIVVKNIENNEAKGKNLAIWQYRALKGGFFIFKHEYILVFRK